MPLKGPGVFGAVRGKRLHRLLQLIAIFRGPTSYNARRLAERFGCSKRNVHRDIAVLELAGVPVYYDPGFGEGGGYRIRSDWWFPQVSLTDRECLELAVVSQITECRAIPMLDEVSTVRDKLLATLPARQSDLIHAASTLFDVLGLHLADHSHCRGVMATVQAALLAGKQVKGRYRSPHRKGAVTKRLEPLRLLLAGRAWYLAAHDRGEGQTRLFRIARFQSLEALDRPIEVDRSVSMRELLGNAWTVHRGDRDWHVEIEFAPEAAELVADTAWHHTQQVEMQHDGSARFRATVSGLEEIQWWVLGFGPRARVIKPPELAQRLANLAEKTAQRYRKGAKHE